MFICLRICYIIRNLSLELQLVDELRVSEPSCEFFQADQITQYLCDSPVFHHDFQGVFAEKFVKGLGTIEFFELLSVVLGFAEQSNEMA